jgi:hypothetical protein
MALSVQPMYQAKLRELVGPQGGTGTTRFMDDFVLAVNRSLDQISIECDLATAIPHITSNDATIVALSAVHESILQAGVTHFMLVMGHGREKADKQAALDAWEDAKANYQLNALNALQADATNDIIGLGAPTTTTDSENTGDT